MGYRLLSVLVFILAIASLPSSILFLIASASILKDRFAFDNLIFFGGGIYSLFALSFAVSRYHQLGLFPLPKWAYFGLWMGIGGVSWLFANSKMFSSVSDLFFALLSSNFLYLFTKIPVMLAVAALFGGAQLLLACLLLLKIWLVKSGRMVVPLKHSIAASPAASNNTLNE